jgi:hypothetical protein
MPFYPKWTTSKSLLRLRIDMEKAECEQGLPRGVPLGRLTATC